jgi:hypothetical protein
VPSEEYREYRLCSLLHVVPSALEDESAVRLDWLLAVDDAVNRARSWREEKAAKNG